MDTMAEQLTQDLKFKGSNPSFTDTYEDTAQKLYILPVNFVQIYVSCTYINLSFSHFY